MPPTTAWLHNKSYLHRHFAVAPGLVTNPRDRIVAVLAVVEEPIVHALGAFRADVAADGLADIDISRRYETIRIPSQKSVL